MSRTGEDTVAGESARTSVPAVKTRPLIAKSRQNRDCTGALRERGAASGADGAASEAPVRSGSHPVRSFMFPASP
ncbi:hypothetical protein Pta02_24050 [Planobispora takensis]|uniref:Uncharacterized protein n=1 Tax=Planobispora takensis TaxID=1367882 RepID=A0A8J3WUZ4_9ACTN|nr:hypothetical protein Pta02_24050 [Planobispora takensis]